MCRTDIFRILFRFMKITHRILYDLYNDYASTNKKSYTDRRHMRRSGRYIGIFVYILGFGRYS